MNVGYITKRECGQGISCEEVCSEEGDTETDLDLDTSCIVVIANNAEDPAQAAREICERFSANYAADPFFCRDLNFLTPASAPLVDLDGWQKVRHVPQGTTWHPANDDLK